MRVKRTERGWAGHFILSHRCRFRRNTLLEYEDIKIVVSTVGLLEASPEDSGFEEVAPGRYFETMAFHADKEDTRYYDADVSKQVAFTSPWTISELQADDKANVMHEVVVKEISDGLRAGNRYEDYI